MLHEPAAPVGKDPAAPYKTRLGLWMFLFYCIFYGGFVAINVISPPSMAIDIIAGLNLATVYGFALIIVALVMALIYNFFCSRKEAEYEKAEKEQEIAASGKGKG